MEGVTSSTLQSLRLKYNAALAAHQGCARALLQARMSGAQPDAALLEAEAAACGTLERARAALLAAMTASITGHDAEPRDPARAPGSSRPSDAS